MGFPMSPDMSNFLPSSPNLRRVLGSFEGKAAEAKGKEAIRAHDFLPLLPLTGWWLTYLSLWNIWVNGKDDIHILNGKLKKQKQSTNQKNENSKLSEDFAEMRHDKKGQSTGLDPRQTPLLIAYPNTGCPVIYQIVATDLKQASQSPNQQNSGFSYLKFNKTK